MKKPWYVQEKITVSQKCFEDPKSLTFYLIQPLNRDDEEIKYPK